MNPPLGEGQSRPLPEESGGIEGTLRDFVKNPARIAFQWQGREISAESWAGAYILEWSRKPGRILPAAFVRGLSYYFYEELKYWTEWQQGGIAVDGPYRLEGLTALGKFFGVQTLDNIQSFPLQELENRPDYIPEDTEHQAGCTFDGWLKGFHLALLQFGELNPSHSLFSELLAGFGTNLNDDFTERYRKLAKKKFRERIHHLVCYAKAWDLFYVPLRFFTDEAALEFMQERHDYSADDLGTFRNLFRKGGNRRKGFGLSGLKPHKPAIIARWNSAAGFSPENANYGSDGTISLKRNAAESHGFNVADTAEALKQFSGRGVRVI